MVANNGDVQPSVAYDPEPGIGGTVVPRLQTAATSRIYTTRTWHRVREIFESILAGAPIYTVSSVRDMRTPELQPIIDRYYRGTGLTGPERIKLFKLVWDALYSEFAGRHALYERNYAGNAVKPQRSLENSTLQTTGL